MAKKATSTKESEKPAILTQSEAKTKPVSELEPYKKILAILPDGKQVEARSYKWDGKPGQVLVEAIDGSVQYDAIAGWMPYPENASVEEAITEQAAEEAEDVQSEVKPTEETTTTNETTTENQP